VAANDAGDYGGGYCAIWFIFSKAGYSKWLALLMAAPLINVIILYFIAFSKWPGRETINS
jgi:hypothetical protein